MDVSTFNYKWYHYHKQNKKDTLYLDIMYLYCEVRLASKLKAVCINTLGLKGELLKNDAFCGKNGKQFSQIRWKHLTPQI